MSAGLVPRPRLHALLDRGAQVTLISAPAGSGKTMLVASWARSGGAPGPIAWVAVDRDETDSSDSVGGAHAVAAQLGGEAGAALVSTANQAFVDAMSTTSLIAAGIALVGALIAVAFLPARASASVEPDYAPAAA